MSGGLEAERRLGQVVVSKRMFVTYQLKYALNGITGVDVFTSFHFYLNMLFGGTKAEPRWLNAVRVFI